MDSLIRRLKLYTTGNRSSRGPPAEPPAEPEYVSGVFDEPWRPKGRGSKDDLRERINAYTPPEGVSRLRILLYGPVGAGKSSFINSIQTALRGYAANFTGTNAMVDGSKSFTRKDEPDLSFQGHDIVIWALTNCLKLKTHKIFRVDGEDYYPFVFIDTMGLEPGPNQYLPEDIKQLMEGHVMDGYKFDKDSALTRNDPYYRQEPSLEDQFHVLVCVLPAASPYIDETIVKKIKQIRRTARDLNIPEMAIVTKTDLSCKEMKDLKNVYKSKYLHKKMSDLSASVGISVNHMFPVKNYSDGNTEGDDDMDELLLTALDHMKVYGNDFVKNLPEQGQS